jgi:hypothetical protein
MDRLAITQLLQTQHAAFIQRFQSLDQATYQAGPAGKWNNGQHLDHILRSVRPVNLAFGLPPFVLRMLFGVANRPSRTYEDLVAKYKVKLAAGGRASGRFIPATADWGNKEKLLTRLEQQLSHLIRKANRLSEEQLDTLLLPHPLLGKLTMREMLYFTAYHVEHHQKAVQENLKNS